MPLSRVCVFCGSSSGFDARYRAAAAGVASALVARGIEVVYGGGRVGLMGVVADTALERGGSVTGVIPKGLFAREVGHTGLTTLHEVASMHERKTLMYDLSDAFIALPGGFGTLEELAEVTTWAQIGLHQKPVALLDVDGFWDGLVTQLDRMVTEGFLRVENRRLVATYDDIESMLDGLESWIPSPAEKWIDDDER
ncbi:MAG TPA: TIGR00730 family Rossman fold protein [Acidimicrobiales bacterium]|jgi:uncharacterized protein (TIGR00730 family)|nr:TIGR00730 family Rossman fold protein [Acidimicrobiales bacterium]